MEVPSEKIVIPKWEEDNRNWTYLSPSHRNAKNRALNFLWGVNHDFSGKVFEGADSRAFDHSLIDYKGINTEIKRFGYSRNLYIALEQIHIPHEGRLYLREFGKLRPSDADILFPVVKNIIYNIYKHKR